MKHLVLFLILCLCPAGSAWAQATGRITGTVTSGTGAPLGGASVSVVGTALGAVTGADGRYAIDGVSAGQRTVRASMIGYGETSRTVTLAGGGGAVADFELSAAAVALDELVVVGYGTARRSDLTGSTSSVRAAEIENLPITSTEQVLQGRAPGVQVVQNSGEPGGGFTVRIRGGNSMLGGNDPLYVIDGFPISTGGERGRNILSTLNPNDIRSIEILKDASATAIYGARGSNGVVMITTKKGSAGSRIDFESYYGTQQVSRKIPLLNARQYAELVNELAADEGRAAPFADLDNLPADTDWQDAIFRSAPLQNYSMSISGGGESTRYMLSGNYMDQEGVVLSSAMNRATLRLNVDSDVGDRLNVSNQLMLARTSHEDVPAGEVSNIVHNAFVAPPTIPVYDAEGNYYDYSNYWWWGSYPRSPIKDANEITNSQTNFRVLENFTAEYTLLEGLKARSLLGVDYLDARNEYYATRLHEFGLPSGSASAGRGENLTYLNENTLNLNREFGDAHRLDVTGGFTWQKAQNSGVSTSSSGFVNDLLGVHGLGTGANVSPPSASASDWTLISWLGRTNYVLADRYLFTVSGRYDGSSRFGAGNKWAFFPSAAFAWRASEEPFLRDSDLLSNLKFRLSWGRTGNQEIGLYQSLQRVAPILLVTGNTLTTGFAPANMANPDLRWETTEQYNAGVDLGLWNERLTLTADTYLKDTSDLLARVNLPGSSGFSNVIQNIGRIRNSGVELGIGATPVQTASLQWNVDANISANRNKVVKLADENDFNVGAVNFLAGSVHLVREGEPLSVFYVFEEDGLDEKGNIRYVDRNGDGAINDKDRFIAGSPYPDFTYGMSTGLTFGSFDVSATLQGVYGNDIFNANLGFAAASLARGENQIVDVYENRWRPDNPDPNAKYPRISRKTIYRASDRYIEDGSYLRLKNVRLGYRIPVEGRVGIEDMLVYVSGQNLLTLTGYSWYDPEVSNFSGSDLRTGVDYYTYPQARTVSVGIRIGM